MDDMTTEILLDSHSVTNFKSRVALFLMLSAGRRVPLGLCCMVLLHSSHLCLKDLEAFLCFGDFLVKQMTMVSVSVSPAKVKTQ